MLEFAAAPRCRQPGCCGSASMRDPHHVPSSPAALPPHAPHRHEPRPAFCRRASPFSLIDIFQNGDIQHRLGQQLLELRVLVLERLQPLGVRHLQTAELRLVLVERGLRDPVLPAYVRRRSPRLLLTQDPYDLLLAEPASLHRPSPLSDGLYPFLEEFSGLRSLRSLSGRFAGSVCTSPIVKPTVPRQTPRRRSRRAPKRPDALLRDAAPCRLYRAWRVAAPLLGRSLDWLRGSPAPKWSIAPPSGC